MEAILTLALISTAACMSLFQAHLLELAADSIISALLYNKAAP
jgi:hypothetical protein